MFVADCVFANGCGVAVIGHVDGDVEKLVEFAADVCADPVIAEVGFCPDHAVGRWGWDIQADAANIFAVDASVSCQFIESGFKLFESGSVTVFDMAFHFDDGPDLISG